MIDLYVDEVSLERIHQKNQSQILVFRNKTKDETLSVPVSNEELVNIYQWAKIRCETLGLIKK